MNYRFITRKALRAMCEGRPVIAAGNDEMQFLLRYHSPNYVVYSRTLGWRCNVYDTGRTVIITGYDTVVPRSPVNPIRHAESIAEAAWTSPLPPRECKNRILAALGDLLDLFVSEYNACKAIRQG